MPFEIPFYHPLFLLLALPGVALVMWRHSWRRSAPALVFPSVAAFDGLPPTLRRRARILVPLCECGAVVLLAGALARPREGEEKTIVRSEGIAIQMVLDRSGSMEEKMRYLGRPMRRIDIVKQVVKNFISGSNTLSGRPTDLIGLTTFARFVEENYPLVAQHEPLLAAVDNLTTVPAWLDQYDQPVDKMPRTAEEVRRRKLKQNPLNRTAIGDGLFYAVTSLVTAEKDLERGEEEGGYRIRGKVIIILTDGEDNASEVDPVEAGKYAEENGIRVYYILMSELVVRGRNFYGEEVVVKELDKDSVLEVPRKVAGDPSRAFVATDGDSLQRIYEAIDRLEKTEIGAVEYTSYKERFHYLLVPGIALALLGMLLSETWLRRIP